MATLVGKTAWHTAVAVMRMVLTVKVMKELNWDGKNKGKIGFAKIAPTLAEAIESTYM